MPIKVHQHIVPRVYLKYFSSESFVHVIQPGHLYRKGIQRKGIKDKIFTKENYYDSPTSANKKYLEDAFGTFEGIYNEIIQRIETRSNIGSDTKQMIVSWVHMMKMRSSFVRDLTSSIFSNIEKFSMGYREGAAAMHHAEKTGKFKAGADQAGKLFQLMNFTPDEYNKSLKDYTGDFLSKEWVIFYSTDLQFLTNDNPGFSITLNETTERLKMSPVFGDYNLSNEGLILHIFPLTPYLCLCVRSYRWPEDITDAQIELTLKGEIRYQKADTQFVDYVNEGVILTKQKLIVGQHAKDIERYLKDQSV